MPQSSLLRAFLHLRHYWKHTLAALLATFGAQLIALAIPQVIRWSIDEGARRGDLALLAWATAALLGLTLVKGVLTFLEGQASEIASQGVAYDLRNAIQLKLTSLSFAFHDASETGELLSRSIQDVERIRFLTGRAALRLVQTALILPGTALALLWMQPTLAALVIITMPLLIYQALHFGLRYRPLSLQIQQQLAVLTTQVEQALRGHRIVKAYAQEPAEFARFAEANTKWATLSAEASTLDAFSSPFLLLIANLSVVLVVWYGGTLVIAHTLSIGELVAFITYVTQLVDPLRRLGLIIPAMAIAASSGERVFELLDAVPDVADAPDATPLPPARGEVRFEAVTFSYRSQKALVHVVSDISFTALPGQVIAVVGPTGSGKSTLVNLIPRFYDPTAGRVLIDGHDIRHVTVRSLRLQIGMVMQESVLFGDTLRHNIAFGRPDATDAEITAAAEAAQAHEFIARLPEGYATRIGERGVTLSGGQKQRLAIARALLLDPRILILDDATAAVDTATESHIQSAFARLLHGRTTFVIAHRLGTVQRADQILVLDHGHIVARGTHAELLATSPAYAEIAARQLLPASTPEAP